MQQRIISLTIIFLLVYTAQAQEPEDDINSNPLEFEGGIRHQQIYETTDEVLTFEFYEKGFFRTRNTPVITGGYIKQYDSARKVIKESKIEGIDFEKNPICSINGKYINGQYQMFLEFYTDYKKRDIYFGILNPYTGKLIQQLQKIDSYEDIYVSDKWNRYNSKIGIYQNIFTSQDASKTLFLSSNYNSTYSSGKKVKAKLYLRCIDNKTGELLWEKNQSTDYTSGEIQIYSIALSNDGTKAHLLLMDIEEKTTKFKYIGREVAINILTFSEKGTVLKTTKLTPKTGYELGSSELLSASNGTLHCIGTYHKGEYNKNITERGLYSAIIDSDNEKVKTIEYKPFEGEIKRLTAENICSSWNDYFDYKKYKTVELIEITEFNDGTLGVITEQVNKKGYTYSKGSSSSNVASYVKSCRQNLFFTTIDNDGINTTKVIPKETGYENEKCFGGKWDTSLKNINQKLYLLTPAFDGDYYVLELSSTGEISRADYSDIEK